MRGQILHTFEKEYPKQLAEFLAQSKKQEIHPGATTKAFVTKNVQLVLALDSQIAQKVLTRSNAIDPNIKGLKHFIKKDIAANLLDIQKLKKMNAQAPQIAAVLRKLPDAKTGGRIKGGLKWTNAISMGVDVFEGTFNTTTALREGNNATAVKEAAKLGATLGSGWAAGYGVAMVFGVATGPVGWVLIAATSAVAAYYFGEGAKAGADWAADNLVNKPLNIKDKNPYEVTK